MTNAVMLTAATQPDLSFIGPLTVANIIRAVNVVRITRILDYVAYTILLWDMLLTFAREIAIVWKSRWTLVKVIFILNRYVTPITLGVNIWAITGLATGLNNDVCRGWMTVSAILQSFSLSLVSLSIALRLFVLYETSKWMLYQMLIVWFLTLVAGFGLMIKLFIVQGYNIVYEPTSNICITVSSNIWIVWLPRACEHGLFCVFLIVNAMYTPRTSQTFALRVLYRDGILYYFITFLNLLASALVWRYAGLLYMGFTLYTTWAFCQVAVARLMLDSRGAKLFQPKRFTPRSHQHSSFGVINTPLQTLDRHRRSQSRRITQIPHTHTHTHTTSRYGSQASYSAYSPAKTISSLPGDTHNNINIITDSDLREGEFGIRETKERRPDTQETRDTQDTGDTEDTRDMRQRTRTAALAVGVQERDKRKTEVLSSFWWLFGRGGSLESETYIDVEPYEEGWEDEEYKGGVKESRLGRLDHWV